MSSGSGSRFDAIKTFNHLFMIMSSSPKIRNILSLWLAAICASASVHAQRATDGAPAEPAANAGKLAPKEPILTPLSMRAEYQVRFYYDFGADWERSANWLSSTRKLGQNITMTTYSVDSKTETARVANTWNNGATYQQWIYKGMLVAPRTDNKGYYVEGSGNLPPSKFPELSWVNLKNFKGAGKFGQRVVFVFREPVSATADKKTTAKQEDEVEGQEAPASASYRVDTKVAYLDAKTQLPVLSNDGQVIRVYSILPSPTDSLSAPKDMVEILEKREALRRDRVALPPNPAS